MYILKMNCNYCGRLTSNQKYCSKECGQKEKAMFDKCGAQPLVFDSLGKVSEYYKRDRRTITKYEGQLYIIDKSKVSSKVKIYTKCLTCDNLSLPSKARYGYCKSCQAKGIGKQQQGRKLAQMYKGEGNPNYVHGESKSTDRTSAKYKHWQKQVVQDKKGHHAHHILPFSLFPKLRYKSWNGLALTPFQHTELHRQQLDIELLPIVYHYLEQQEMDAPNLPVWYSLLPQVQSVLQLDGDLLDQFELLRVVGSNYRRQLSNRHPQFVQQVFPHWET